MCGINGIAFSNRSAKSVEERVLNAMRDAISHRGPDEADSFIEKNIGFGHRRLSIVDLKSGQQPMFNEDRSCVIVFNGEVFNHADYRAELEAKGHVYQSHCDTETILHLYEDARENSVEKLRGMFAYAIWDKSKRELFAVRDRLGVKPFYYAHLSDGSLIFASEIKAILASGLIKAELNFAALPDYLANHGTTSDETLFAGIKRLPAGHFLKWRETGELDIKRYWDIEFEPKFENKSDAEFVAEWFELFTKSVEMRLMADVPLGMFLSGGIDSSAICAVMSKMVSAPIKTFSVAFAEREANEFEYARIVAKAFQTEHHEIIVSPKDFFDALPELIWHEDEPLAHPSSVALNFVSRLAAQHVKVVLTGEGSDESLAGYGRYAKTLLNLKFGKKYETFTPNFARQFARNRIEAMNVGSKIRHKLKKSFLSVESNIESIYFDNFAVFSRQMQTEMLTVETREKIGGENLNPYRAMQNFFDSAESGSLLDRMLYADTKTYLHELLMKQDQMSMAASIESRVPFLDHKLMEFAARMPDRMKLRGSTTKYVLREAMKGILPDEILTRPKMGFPVPFGEWLRGEYKYLIDEYIAADRTLDRNLFHADFVKSIVQRHLRGEDHSERLWALLNLEMWQRRFIDGEN